MPGANGEDGNSFVLGDQPTKDTVSPDQFAFRYTQDALKFIAAADGEVGVPETRRVEHLAHALRPRGRPGRA